ncbi:MAG TPA: hypothetical protein DEF88_08635 [Porphyromonadaceae bacterium]|jgi:hypothetical protein|nr:hypothetical protein [Porphyromonadaceae bacterium]HBX20499.1 hypothetical protein [Porphyromonadaceae bacterium]HCM21242.1 hypothetical protein [Porphyromonadaceae bacterium]
MNNIKLTITFTEIFIILLNLEAFSQSKREESFEFEKRIAPSMITLGIDNTVSKNNIHNRLFPDHNGVVEYVINPSFSGYYGFRINLLENNTYTIEVKWVDDWEIVQKRMVTEFPVKESNYRVLQTKSKQEQEEILRYNREQYSKRFQKAVSEYTIKTMDIPISKSLADQFLETYVSLIEKHINKGVPKISRDGYTAIFRCVVEDEVWNFSIKNPLGIFKELTNICDKIVKDVQKEKRLNDSQYVEQLEELVKDKE